MVYFFLGMLRLNLNIDYDKLKDLADNHRTIRLMLGHSIFDYKKYNAQKPKDNIKLFTPAVLAQINNVVVQTGHDFKNKKGPTKGKCDSFVVETNVHFPTDISLLYDAIRKMIELTAGMCKENDVKGYRQYQNKIIRLKRLARIIARMKKSAPFITSAPFYLPDAYGLSNSSVINAEIMKDIKKSTSKDERKKEKKEKKSKINIKNI